MNGNEPVELIFEDTNGEEICTLSLAYEDWKYLEDWAARENKTINDVVIEALTNALDMVESDDGE